MQSPEESHSNPLGHPSTSYFLSSAGKCLPSVQVTVHIAAGAGCKMCILGRSFVNLAWGLFSRKLLWTICHWLQVWQTSPFRLIQIKIRNASLELRMKYRLWRHHCYLWRPKTDKITLTMQCQEFKSYEMPKLRLPVQTSFSPFLSALHDTGFHYVIMHNSFPPNYCLIHCEVRDSLRKESGLSRR